jgi:5-methylcytosine-specific restriction protein A
LFTPSLKVIREKSSRTQLWSKCAQQRAIPAKIAERIESLLAELEHRPQAPVAAFEAEVHDLIAKPLSVPEGSAAPSMLIASVTQYRRDPAVKAWTLQNAKGRCECCNTSAPFVDAAGMPYLEVHHVLPLAEGGADTVSNAVAVCPNCHRALHYGQAKAELAQQLRQRLDRLR